MPPEPIQPPQSPQRTIREWTTQSFSYSPPRRKLTSPERKRAASFTNLSSLESTNTPRSFANDVYEQVGTAALAFPGPMLSASFAGSTNNLADFGEQARSCSRVTDNV